MKIIYKVEVEIDDEYVKEWTENHIDFDMRLNKCSKEEAIEKIKKDKPLENSVVDVIVENLMESGVYKNCKAEIYESEMD